MPEETTNPLDQVEEIRTAITEQVDKLRNIINTHVPDKAAYYERYMFGPLADLLDGEADSGVLSANLNDLMQDLEGVL